MPIVSIHGLRKLARKGGVYTHTGAAEDKKDGDKSPERHSACVWSLAWRTKTERTKVSTLVTVA